MSETVELIPQELQHQITIDAKLIPRPILLGLIKVLYEPNSMISAGDTHQSLLMALNYSHVIKDPILVSLPYNTARVITTMCRNYPNRGERQDGKPYTTHNVQSALYQVLEPAQQIKGVNAKLDLLDRHITQIAQDLNLSIGFVGQIALKMACLETFEAAPKPCASCFYGALNAARINPFHSQSQLRANSGASTAGCIIARQQMLESEHEIGQFENWIVHVYESQYEQPNN